MNFAQFIYTYQALAGSFLAIFSTICLWYAKEQYEKRKLLKNNKKEIKNIFFMMARDTEESVRDLTQFVPNIREKLSKHKDEFHIFQHSGFNRVYINEERLFVLKQGIDFVLSQQIDIAISSAKKFNSYMESIEIEPAFIFDSTVKTIESGIETKEKAVADYKKSIAAFLNKLEFMLAHDIKKSQINILRPIVALAPKYKKMYKHVSMKIIDDLLDKDAGFVLVALKHDLT